MKKSTLLSLLTATSITLTTAGTYAAWDSVQATATSEVITFRNPVTVEVTKDNYTLTKSEGVLGQLPTASGDVSFTISNNDGLGDTLTIVPEVSGGTASVDDFDFVIKDTNDSSKSLEKKESGFVDKSLGSTNYNITVTPKDDSKDIIEGQPITIKLKATLSKSTE